MAAPKIKLYIDIVSPFAYIGYYLLRHHPTFKHCEIHYVPILLGGVMKATGNTPPLRIKNKDKWIEIERNRWAKYFNIPVGNTPEGFPINTVLPMRALTFIYKSHPDKFTTAVDAIWDAFWGNENKAKVQTPEGLTKVLNPALGEDLTKKVLSESGSDAAKKGLSEFTEQAINDGCFGLPYFIATNPSGNTENYWGVDHLGQVCDHLGIKRGTDAGMRALM